MIKLKDLLKESKTPIADKVFDIIAQYFDDTDGIKPLETFIERLYSFEQFSDKEDLDDAKKVYPKVKSMIQTIDKQRTKQHQINLKQLQNKFNELERKLK